MEIIALIKSSLIPGSVGFLLCGVTCGLLLLHGPASAVRWGRRSIAALILFYWVIAVPAVALQLEGTLARRYDTPDPRLREAKAIVVLGSGSHTCRAADGEINLPAPQTAFSVLEAVRLYRLLEPAVVIASGGAPNPDRNLRSEAEVVREVLLRAGVPAERIVLEDRSLNTHDQAVNVARLLRDRKIGPFVLVASKTHLPRAVALFRAQGLGPIPSGSAIRSEGVTGWTSRLWPTMEALEASRMVAYHYLAMVYAWSQGWTKE